MKINKHQPDPFGLPLYNNPINYRDPYGLVTMSDAADSLVSKNVTPEYPAQWVFTGDVNVYIPARYSNEQLFNEWYELELADMDWLSGIPDCPDRIDVSSGVGEYCGSNSSGWNNVTEASQKYHPNAAWDMRSNTWSGSGQQCTYDSDGNLLKSGLSAGTPDRYAPSLLNGLYLQHLSHDVNPFDIAQLLDGEGVLGDYTTKYLEVRPPNQGGGE